MLWVYFQSLPSAGPRVRDMLSDSVRHVLRLLRSIAELNAAAEVRKGFEGFFFVKGFFSVCLSMYY